jgi:hypothetical protein
VDFVLRTEINFDTNAERVRSERNFDVTIAEWGLHVEGKRCNVEFAYQPSICSRTDAKPRKTLIELAGRRTFRIQTDFSPAVRH